MTRHVASAGRPHMVVEETITWHHAANRLPDSDITVLIHAPSLSEPVWLGFHNGESWCAADGLLLNDGVVLAWADLPEGPFA